MNERTTIDVIMVKPGEAPYVMTMEDNLESMQAAVGGMIEEYMPFDDDVALVCNEEGKIMGLPNNRTISGEDGQLMDIISGPFFIAYAPPESEVFLSVPEDLREKYMKKFESPEQFHFTHGGVFITNDAPARDDFER